MEFLELNYKRTSGTVGKGERQTQDALLPRLVCWHLHVAEGKRSFKQMVSWHHPPSLCIPIQYLSLLFFFFTYMSIYYLQIFFLNKHKTFSERDQSEMN